MMRAWLVIGTIGLWSCSRPVVFQGQSTLAVNGTPPAPVVEAKAPPRVEVRDNKIEIHEKIQFDYDKATIKEASFGLIDEIAAVIAKNPQLKRLRIEGYASSEGDAKHNLALSDSRSRAVMKYLTDHGVSPNTLTAVGYGEDTPIADNNTEDGREKNRRVEFVILEQDVTQKKVEIDAKTGAEKVVEENHETIKASELGTAASHAADKAGAETTVKPALETPRKGS
jgi:OOP family OmpA-OmpF porin